MGGVSVLLSKDRSLADIVGNYSAALARHPERSDRSEV
jgi:hypothetical protein